MPTAKIDIPPAETLLAQLTTQIKALAERDPEPFATIDLTPAEAYLRSDAPQLMQAIREFLTTTAALKCSSDYEHDGGEMAIDDAFETANALIEKARDLTVYTPDLYPTPAEQLLPLIARGLCFADCVNAFANNNRSPELTAAAREHRLLSDGELELDDRFVFSHGDDPGAYALTWLWIKDPKVSDDDDEREGETTD